MRYFIIIFIAHLLTACGEEKKPLPQDFDRSGEQMTVTVHTYPDYKSMRRARQDHDGMNDPALMGWATWTAAGEGVCDIHVVRLNSENDNKQMATWGHELAHCVHGNFHP